MNKEKLRDIARDVREWGESVVSEDSDYCNDLCGLCARASYELYKKLRKKKIPAVFVIGYGHCWVEVAGLLIDVTATQFWGMKKRKVLIEKVEKAYEKYGFYNPLKKRKTPKGIRNGMKKWPIYQVPQDFVPEGVNKYSEFV